MLRLAARWAPLACSLHPYWDEASRTGGGEYPHDQDKDRKNSLETTLIQPMHQL